MINVLKTVLQDGMEIEKVKEMANEYRVTLKYKGMTGNCSVSKMCSPGNEKSLCMKSIDTAISGMYINAGNLEEAKAWLDGERWHAKRKYPEYIMSYVRQNMGLDSDDTSNDDLINSMNRKDIFDRVLNWNGIIGYAGQIKGWIEEIYGIELE